MTVFTAQVSQNEFLAPDVDHVQAVVSVSSTPQAGAGPRPLVEALLLDCSASMGGGEKIQHARQALTTSINLLPEDAWFCVIAGSEMATVAAPLARATAENKRAAQAAVARLKAHGGTAMSTWLAKALQEFRKVPGAIRHALLLTDGKNEGESDEHLIAAVHGCEGEFQCDARGVGTDWVPDQLRLISGKLLGTVDIIPRPADIAGDFHRVIETALSKAVADVRLRVWTPRGAEIESCSLVYPEKVDLTDRGRRDSANPQLCDYPTGAWGEEKRDYHLRIRVSPGKVGQRMCAARASIVVGEGGQETKAAEAMILAVWTDDEARSAVLNPAVAHYTGQAELADAIQSGLKARAAGDEARAVALLGRAVQIAAESNPETMELLSRVVEVEDARAGTVKLRRGVRKEDEFALDTRSTRTSRKIKG
jgi:hypothetical protein